MAATASVSSFLTQLYGRSSRSVFAVSVTGGGVQALQWLFSTPGASRCIQDGSVPYSRSALDAYLGDGGLPSSVGSASAEAAALMSTAARKKALQTLLADSGGDLRVLGDCCVFGVACTAALASTAPKKGPHRCHVAVTGAGKTRVYSLTLEKGLRSREGEDEVCSRLLIDAIAIAAEGGAGEGAREGAEEERGEEAPPGLRFCRETLAASERVESSTLSMGSGAGADAGARGLLEAVRSGHIGQVLFLPHRAAPTQLPTQSQAPTLEAWAAAEPDVCLPPGALVFPGSFNPLHAAHVELLQVALRKVRRPPSDAAAGTGTGASAGAGAGADTEPAHPPVVFEIAAVNVDKPPLGQAELAARLQALLHSPLLAAAGISNFGVCITSEPLFVRKAALFRGCSFVVGADTMARLVNPTYYRRPAFVASAVTATATATGTAASAGAAASGAEDPQAASAMVAALASIAERGCRFVVGGRTQQGPAAEAGRFETLADILQANQALLPDALSGVLFAGIDESEFRVDLSSSEIRARAATKP